MKRNGVCWEGANTNCIDGDGDGDGDGVGDGDGIGFGFGVAQQPCSHHKLASNTSDAHLPATNQARENLPSTFLNVEMYHR